MTTMFTFKNYDVYKHEASNGEFPYKYWKSETIPLYGCKEVSVNLNIFPTGCTTGRGYVSAFVEFNCSNPNIYLEVQTSIRVHGTANITRGLESYKVGRETECEFGSAWGWNQFCELDNIFKATTTLLYFSVTVLKITEVNGRGTIITQPAGEQETIVD
jgi:hypothetical protein